MRLGSIPFLMFSFLIIGCAQKPVEKPPAKPPEVLVTDAVTDTIVDFEEFTGHTEAKNMIEVKARVTGYLRGVRFKDGDFVKEGQTLFEIEPHPFQIEVQKAEATLHKWEVKFERMDADYRRATVSRQRGVMSQEEYDRIKSDRGEAEASVGVAKGDLEKARVNLGYTKVTMPVLDDGTKPDPDHPRVGRVSRRMKDPGNLIKADETMLTTIVTLDPMYVYFDVDERTVLTMRSLIAQKKIKSINDMTFKFELANDEGTFPYEGKINFEDNKLDSGTGTLQLRGEFENSNGLSHGQFARIRLFVGTPRKVVLVPERALGTDQGQKFLYVVKRDTDKEGNPAFKAEYRGGAELELGALRDGWRVVEKGVQAGDSIIWSGLQRVRKDGSITPASKAPPSPKQPQAAAK